MPPPPPPLLLPVNVAGSTLVATATVLLLVFVRWMVLPALTLVMVMMTSETEEVVIRVRLGVTVVWTVLVDWDVLSSEVWDGVRVDVVVSTTVDCEEVGPTVIVEEVVMTEADVGWLEVREEEVGSSLLVVIADDDSEVSEPPVLKGTLWRLNRAMASSRGSAATIDAVLKAPRRRTAKERILARVARCEGVMTEKFIVWCL
jgi:hypothetical protein